jgi:hypothetical protein
VRSNSIDSRWFAALVAGALAALSCAAMLGAQTAPMHEVTVLETSAAARAKYLAQAVIWTDRELPSAEDIVEGPPGLCPVTRAEANPPEGVPCTYEHGGTPGGGNTDKFTCRTRGDQIVRVKYYGGDAQSGNREVFSEVAATRLFWALGFDADATYPVRVACNDCPENPMTGKGPRAARKFLGAIEPHFGGAAILSGSDLDEGWTFGELDSAIDTLPSETRSRQRAAFDALSLLAVFVQHGDRKPSQQRLVCAAGALDDRAGVVHDLSLGGGGVNVPAFYERPGVQACRTSKVMIQDLGATFGGAGRTTNRVTAKMNLEAWASVQVFNSAGTEDAPRECHGHIISSIKAGDGRRDDPRIGEAGRKLLADRLSRLSDAQIRAIFEAARVDALGEQTWKNPKTKAIYRGTDGWVEIFKQKRAEIVNARCVD